MNANVPVNISAGDISSGDNSANQFAANGALSGAGNNADTDQTNDQTQNASIRLPGRLRRRGPVPGIGPELGNAPRSALEREC